MERTKPMRNLRFILVIFIMTLVMPQMATTQPIADELLPVDVSAPAASLPRVYDMDLAGEIFELVDQDRYRSYVQDFTANGSRHIYRYQEIPGTVNEMAHYWLVDKMTEVSNERLEIEIIGDYKNVVGRLPGYLPGDNPVFVMSAHYDTMPFCPGANDAGAGIAAVIELLGIMSLYEWPLDIYFIAFNGAEARYDILTPPTPGRLQGSEEVAGVFDNRNLEILAHFDVGAILREENHSPYDARVFLSYYDLGLTEYHVSQYWAELGRALSNWYGRDFIQTVSSNVFIEFWRADIRKFIARGFYSVVLAFENGLDDDNVYQSQLDVWHHGQYSYSIGREVTAAIGACMAYTMSQAYGKATRILFEGVTFPGFSLRKLIPVSMATTLEITARWFGSSAAFLIYNPSGALIASSMQTTTNPWNYTQVFSLPVTQKGLYTFEVWDTGEDSLGLDSYIDYEVDINGNGISDQNEYWINTNLFQIDSDSDTISDGMEIVYGTDGSKVDSDDDTIPDNWEIDNGLDPTDPNDASLDFDNDTLTNSEEYSYGLNPNSIDSDMDLLPDAWEIAYGLDPLVNDADEDPDEDGYTNLDEYYRGSDPLTGEVEEPPYILWIGVPSAALILIGIAAYFIRRE